MNWNSEFSDCCLSDWFDFENYKRKKKKKKAQQSQLMKLWPTDGRLLWAQILTSCLKLDIISLIWSSKGNPQESWWCTDCFFFFMFLVAFSYPSQLYSHLLCVQSLSEERDKSHTDMSKKSEAHRERNLT